MKMAGYTKQERSLIIWFRILGVAFFLGGVLFAALPNYTINYITDVGRGVFGWHSPNMPPEFAQFWLPPAVSLLFALSYLCAIVQKDPPQYIEYVNLMLIAKFVSAVGFAVLLFTEGLHFFYLAGASIDGLIFIITFAIYKGADRSRNRWS